MELQSFMKRNGHYSVYGVYFATDKGWQSMQKGEDGFLPEFLDENKPFTSKDTPTGRRTEEKK